MNVKTHPPGSAHHHSPIIFMVEAQIPPPIPIPGIKLGLANIVTVYAMLALSPGEALAILVCRVFLGGVFSGQLMTLFYSMGGRAAVLAGDAAAPPAPHKKAALGRQGFRGHLPQHRADPRGHRPHPHPRSCRLSARPTGQRHPHRGLYRPVRPVSPGTAGQDRSKRRPGKLNRRAFLCAAHRACSGGVPFQTTKR